MDLNAVIAYLKSALELDMHVHDVKDGQILEAVLTLKDADGKKTLISGKNVFIKK